ncbi:NAD(P)-dependent oxidoreductase [Marinomonas balearica]|uniref:Putative NADH-flavin reductase n=1 Tax=Marinomonas balearica TaxID=491947 RepID=A0A4V3CH66_9GAMM|nr:NAD(P)H-binding protein [Marinomonas balearica]TDP00483.1 putative NADH-flavin reductase [Marinomonas balearica]
MKIAILGATGFTGKVLVKKALERHYSVRVLARDPNKLASFGDAIEIIEGDYFDEQALNQVVEGIDVVLSTIGAPATRKTSLNADNFADAMTQLIDSMTHANVKRFINLASAGTRFEGEKVVFIRGLIRLFFSITAPVVIPAKEKELAILQNSALEWTTIRPPLIQENVKGSLQVSSEFLKGNKVDVEHLTDFMLDNIHSKDWISKAPFVTTEG